MIDRVRTLAASTLLGALVLAPTLAHAQTPPPATPPADSTTPPADSSPPVTQGSGDNGQNGKLKDIAGPQGALPMIGVGVQGGPGLALSADGRSRLHVGVDVGAGVDTNPYAVPLQDSAFSGDLVARVRPHLDIDYPGSTLAFTGTGLLDYGFLPGVLDVHTQSFLLYQSYLAANLEVNRGGTVGFALGDTFSWNSDPGATTLGVLFNRITDQLRAGVFVRPGGGALELRLTYTFDIAKYLDATNLTGGGFVPQQSALIESGALDNMTNSLTLRADYKFLPKTGFFALVSAGVNTYLIAITDPNNPNNVNPDAYPVTALVGVQGQILSKVMGLVSLGYSNPLIFDHAAGAPPGSAKTLQTATLIGVSGQAEVQWLPSPVTRLGIGFQRGYSPTAFYQYLGNNRFYANATQMIGGRFLVGANAGYSLIELGREELPLTQFSQAAGGLGRFDQHLDFLASVSYYFTDWVSLGVTDRFDWQITNAEDISTIGLAGATPTNLSYIRNQTVLLASVFY